MAQLTAGQREAVWVDAQRGLTENTLTTAGTKAQWRVLLNALDTYLESNAAAINTAIPQPEREVFTAREKVYALALMIRHRFNVGA